MIGAAGRRISCGTPGAERGDEGGFVGGLRAELVIHRRRPHPPRKRCPRKKEKGQAVGPAGDGQAKPVGQIADE